MCYSAEGLVKHKSNSTSILSYFFLPEEPIAKLTGKARKVLPVLAKLQTKYQKLETAEKAKV